MACLGLESAGENPLWFPSSICSRQRHRETAALVLVRFYFGGICIGLGAAREGPRGYRKHSEVMTVEETVLAKVDRLNLRIPRRFKCVHERTSPLPDILCFLGIFWEAPLPDWVRECAVASRAIGVKP
jgi:hypothetical protein